MRAERFEDRSERYEQEHAATTDPAERKRLMEEFAAERQAYRLEEEQAGRRGPGISITIEQVMWVRWLEVAVDHESQARQAFVSILAGDTSGLSHELQTSLVAICAAAFSVEAVYEDIRYLLPKPTKKPNERNAEIVQGFEQAFGDVETQSPGLAARLTWLFEARNDAAHPYTEPERPTIHPSGVTTGIEHSTYNAYTSKAALDTAMETLTMASNPEEPRDRWITRWVERRVAYFELAAGALSEAREAFPLPEP